MVPRVGLFATVRNRRGLTTSVEPFDGPTGRLHLVQIEYKDDQFPRNERLIWELEPARRMLEPTALPNVGSSDPMPADDFDALLRATRWSAATPFFDPDGSGPLERLPVASPFHGAVQVDDFQLVPLLKALRMPRDNLLLADDVGLGKTVETGRRLRRGMFVAQVVGKSMEPRIPDGSYCLFSTPVEGSRQGKIVLVRLSSETDPESGARYTVKRYESEKSYAYGDDDTWRYV